MQNTNKYFYIDVETTGTDPEENGLVQLAGIIEIDGEEKERINLLVAPFDDDKIEQSALDVIGKTEEELILYDGPKISYSSLIKTMATYIDRYDRSDKFHFIGYNSRFDDSFIRSFFKKCGDKYYGSWFHWPAIDVSNLAAIKLMNQRSTMKNFRLMTVAEELGIEVEEEKAHDAFYDIQITKMMYEALSENIYQ